MRFGQDSIAFLKPEENGGLMGGAVEEMQGGMEDVIVEYDFVEDNRMKFPVKP